VANTWSGTSWFIEGDVSAPLSVSTPAGIPQVSKDFRKLATTSVPVVLRRASMPRHSREWSSMMSKIETSVPSASCQ
jgi:hypothetical protein